MNKNIKWLLVIIWIIVIFMFSNQPGNVSDEKSKFVVGLFNAIGVNLNNVFGNMANFAVRKASHFIEYLILYILIFNAVYKKHEIKRALLISLILVFVYACMDEVHQLFIPGRSSRIRDIIIDTTGGFAGLLLSFYHSYKKGRTVQDEMQNR
ncbi:MAG: VanZ family protein [Clostridium sp.]|jgi:VanZ family protein|uniref:VanZ family protein n=1 Tax=Clostridium sp. TaxID=1506 RepID=UPI0025BE9792|nr:VanZ family protein [Clostridium sp.]MCH3965399.1 VanZ family protein [Clostridium sp.]MCI1717369.1 VanZ family protein [Clostridium sp.]MCI1801709.1 VanZ family protein [Clostridium sp.]MCI1815540.1 VanZ family protein [Clostridium sp.]MCI1872443.1 VanZ family protein [Clostridium sp.]